MDKDTQNISVPENLKPEDISSGEELVPAEVAARKAREGEFTPDPKQGKDKSVDTTAGYTVSEQGLVNNYAVTPEVYEEQKSSVQKRRDYTMLGVVALAVGILLIGAAITVNLLA
ncbi:hypothetical protein AWQ21_00940 [Picosynechococcus sp. PCC 7003]|uniref:hypothetical protein n=1 Tax=Picosynechococcus sp. PCC 7003 TaxID=374981 RepID=UPI00081086BE|nr:hypothetical protein [Picosynechococcus sp. PCC 7003]ANV83081.1 hypothetical protein AWQ21_00940 [Picosynechococcus sp. PCC 7003]